MLKLDNHNPKVNNNFILGKGLNNFISQPSPSKPNTKIKKDRNNKRKKLPKQQQEFLRYLINKTGKGFKKL